MKTKIYPLVLLLFWIINKPESLIAQGESIEQATLFGSRIKNPVVVDVRTDDYNIYFNVNNKSYYLYVIEIKFGDFRNLSPRAFDRKFTLLPGNNRLFTFKIVDPNEAPVLSYETKSYMAKSDVDEEKFSPYLIPSGSGKPVLFKTGSEEGANKIFIDQFVMNTNDTVFNSRKGVVTALPDIAGEIDRIIAAASLEIRHDDGTIAVYLGLSPEVTFLKPGQMVYPGQPIGIIGSSKVLTFRVFELQDEGRLKSFNIQYTGADSKAVPYQNLQGSKVFYPVDLIEKEMTKKEISKYKKHTLY